jgi:hypothetical protein
MSTPPTPTTGERLRIGASLIPPFALLWLACRKGWIPLDPRGAVVAMPFVLVFGFLLPAPFTPWHRWVEKARSWIGRRLVFALLSLVWIVVVLPTSLVLRALGKRFLDPRRRESYWEPARPPGSLRDGF